MTISNNLTPKLRHIPALAGADAIYEIIQEDGGVIVEGLLSTTQVKALNDEIEPYLSKLKAGGRKADDFQENFLGANMKRLGHLAYISPTFRHDILNHELIHQVCERAFCKDAGDYWMNSNAFLETGPGNQAQVLHRDQVIFPVFNKMGPPAPEALLNFFFAMTDFTDENGATRVIPKSNQWPDYNKLGSPEQTVPAEMKAGDAFLFSGKLVHGGGHNRSQDYYRRALSLCMQPCYLTPQESSINIPRDILESMTPLAQKMVAWRSVYPPMTGGLWTLDMNELGGKLGLRSNVSLNA
ncbi:phytanoyl-CoA dioxygenase family protein [Aspergillus stella-maris]|uniref:phytanoyl-CoA dioxygenase family protein n=1 Tax=Aspergillus stella-maris TaxID=1810926 RepID=UPI003CCDDE65